MKAFIELFKDIWKYTKARKKYWLVPLIFILILFGTLIIITQGSAIAPFIYTIF